MSQASTSTTPYDESTCSPRLGPSKAQQWSGIEDIPTTQSPRFELTNSPSRTRVIWLLSQPMAEVRRANGLTEDFELGETQRVHVPSVVYGAPTIEIPVIQPSTSPPKDRRMLLANVQFAALCWSMFMAGWNDGSTGPLLPRIQSVYNVGFAVVSLIFVLNSTGYVIGSFLNVILTDKLGFGKTIVIGLSSLVLGYSIQAAAPPFPLFVISYAINGWGLAFQCAQSIGYVAAYKGDFDAAGRMGFLNAAYGVGALCAPLVGTQFARQYRWSFYYLVSLGLALSNSIFLSVVFKFKRQEECFEEIGQIIENEDQNNDNKYRQIFGLKAVHILALFILIYVGTEVTIGGWIVTFIIQVRGGGASSGYISTGFFAGMTLGRTGLLWLNKKVGERTIIFIYILLAIALEFIIWFVPSFTGGAVAIALIGTLLGPVYPLAMNHARRVLPAWLLTGCIGWIAGFGQAGSAVLPFVTGAIASKAGIASLQPLLVSMMGMLVLVWAFVPRARSHAD